VEHLIQGLSRSLVILPAGEALGFGVQKRHVAPRIGGDHASPMLASVTVRNRLLASARRRERCRVSLSAVIRAPLTTTLM